MCVTSAISLNERGSLCGPHIKEATMNVAALKKAMIFGIAGTAVLTAFTYLAGFMNLPHPDYHGMISGLFHTGTTGSWLLYFAAGVLLAYVYKAFLAAHLPAHSWKNGIVYGFLLWGITQFILMPVFGMGFFSGSMMTAVGMLVGNAFYGAIVGYLYSHSH